MEIVCINCIDNFFLIVKGVIILGTHINWFCFSWVEYIIIFLIN
jgi:hypothetical protein